MELPLISLILLLFPVLISFVVDFYSELRGASVFTYILCALVVYSADNIKESSLELHRVLGLSLIVTFKNCGLKFHTKSLIHFKYEGALKRSRPNNKKKTNL
jgi:intracellular septation protein A